jgi:chromate transport protein ChrA
MVAAAGLVITSTVPLAKDALTSPLAVGIALASFLFLVLTRKDTFWVVLGSAVIGLLGKLL